MVLVRKPTYPRPPRGSSPKAHTHTHTQPHGGQSLLEEAKNTTAHYKEATRIELRELKRKVKVSEAARATAQQEKLDLQVRLLRVCGRGEPGGAGEWGVGSPRNSRAEIGHGGKHNSVLSRFHPPISSPLL